jgi:ABC-type bacteriocin/lantibiotic exporter with double-glycine peptidase domain
MGLFLLIIIAKWTGNTDSAAFITIGAFMAAAYRIIPGVVKVINVAGQIKAYEFSVTEILNNLNPENQFNPEIKVGIESVTFHHVGFEYVKLPVLKNFNLTIKKGELVGITGKSGKGKTTIFNLLLGFLTPLEGKILVNNMVPEDGRLKRYWPEISYVRQQPFLIHDTILKNITLEETVYDEKKLEYALNASGLDEFISKSPEGIEKMITENGKNISGGQQQRIALARALYKNADLILLDEPFNELDEASELLLLEHFRKLADNGKLVIIITHDTKSLSFCNKIVSLNEQ